MHQTPAPPSGSSGLPVTAVHSNLKLYQQVVELGAVKGAAMPNPLLALDSSSLKGQLVAADVSHTLGKLLQFRD